MNRLRLNPVTGRLAERLPEWAPAEDDRVWISYRFDEGANGNGLTVDLLTSDDVADWTEAIVTRRPPVGEFAVAMACTECPPHGLVTEVQQREQIAVSHGDHEGHDVGLYAVRIQHPDREPAEPPVEFPPGSEVTFHGAGEGDAAALVDATVQEPMDSTDRDGEPVSGYVVTVEGRAMFVPATALYGV